MIDRPSCAGSATHTDPGTPSACRAQGPSSSPLTCVMSCPSNQILPSVGSNRRIATRARVDLPQPVSPTNPRVSPGIHLEVDPIDRVHRTDLLLDG